ncbi:Pimeloyl-ACP methyl ester carboxylesterase [Devosia enhydra]|uniref:Pimeloyl-ACP methyl ester carboxylesterase n=1 Tax=Devosia enhydra TaxID=665118 RepID=A0A1K2I056_9HYPH|nr:alpha/beta hydrolase [Devosia enhydra]SFZ85712.1 Pimeloyl-ACP methyl ester carboxylesterase [Devosia enhydra]
MAFARVSSEGITLATESFGSGERGTILLVMGATASMLWWPDTLCEALAAGGYRVIRFDHRDTGHSTTGAPGEIAYDLDDMVGDLLAILDHHAVPAAHLVGMSLGGLLGQIAAIAHADRVESLTLIAAEPLGLEYEGSGMAPALLDQFGALAELDWSDANAVAAFLFEIARLSAGSAPGFDAEDARRRIAAEMARTASMQSAFNHALLKGDVAPGLTVGAIGQPVLVIHGTDDPVIAYAAAEATRRALPQAQIMTLEGRGHEIAPADVPAIGARILAFLGEAAPPRS